MKGKPPSEAKQSLSFDTMGLPQIYSVVSQCQSLKSCATEHYVAKPLTQHALQNAQSYDKCLSLQTLSSDKPVLFCALKNFGSKKQVSLNKKLLSNINYKVILFNVIILGVM
jgi:hypothetical protein